MHRNHEEFLWNTFRKKASGTPVKQEDPEDQEMINYPDSFTGDLPENSMVGLDCHNRPDQFPSIAAIDEAKQAHDDDQVIMTCKAPGAFEWRMNQGWNAENRLQQRIHLEESKDPPCVGWTIRQKDRTLYDRAP